MKPITTIAVIVLLLMPAQLVAQRVTLLQPVTLTSHTKKENQYNPGRVQLYAAGFAGQAIGIGIGYLVGQVVGREPCPPEEFCEWPWPDKRDASIGAALIGAVIAPPIAVHLVNIERGNIWEDYFYSGATIGLLGLLAGKHHRIWYVVPLAQVASIAEAELSRARKAK